MFSKSDYNYLINMAVSLVALAKFGDQLEGFLEGLTGQSPLSAFCMAGPSVIGSEKGMPNLQYAAPASGSPDNFKGCLIIGIARRTKVTSAGRFPKYPKAVSNCVFSMKRSLLKSGYRLKPRALPVITSLSPRPAPVHHNDLRIFSF